jgi:hypothetical protein
MIKNKKYNKKKPLFIRRFIRNNLLKNPKNGGTPAKENKKIVKKNKYELEKLNIEKEYNVLKFFKRIENNNQKKPSNVKL